MRPTIKQRKQIRGALGGWVLRSETKIISVTKPLKTGEFEAVVKFKVSPRPREEVTE